MLVLLSGTPVSKKWEDLYATMTLLRDAPAMDYDTFANIFGSVKEKGLYNSPHPEQLGLFVQLLQQLYDYEADEYYRRYYATF